MLEFGMKDSLFLVFQDAKEEIMIQLQRFNRLFIEEDRGEKSPFALVVDGKALELCLNTNLSEKFLSVAMNCDVVICCRVSPKQKASVGGSCCVFLGLIAMFPLIEHRFLFFRSRGG